jgi:hypothetical protein
MTGGPVQLWLWRGWTLEGIWWALRRLFIARTSLGEFMNWALFIGSLIAFYFQVLHFYFNLNVLILIWVFTLSALLLFFLIMEWHHLSTYLLTQHVDPSTYILSTYTLPTPAGVGHHRTESTNIGCNQWLSLAKIALKMPLADRNRSLVASTSRCGEGITYMPIYTLNCVVSHMWQPKCTW